MAKKWFTNGLKEAIELLYQAQGLVSQAREIIESVRDEQEEKFDNLPEGLQMSANGERMEERIEMFEDLMSDLENLEDGDIEKIHFTKYKSTAARYTKEEVDSIVNDKLFQEWLEESNYSENILMVGGINYEKQ